VAVNGNKDAADLVKRMHEKRASVKKPFNDLKIRIVY